MTRYKKTQPLKWQFIKVIILFFNYKVHRNNVKTTLNEQQQLQSRTKSDGDGKLHSATMWRTVNRRTVSPGEREKLQTRKTGVNCRQINDNTILRQINHNKGHRGAFTNESLDILN